MAQTWGLHGTCTAQIWGSSLHWYTTDNMGGLILNLFTWKCIPWVCSFVDTNSNGLGQNITQEGSQRDPRQTPGHYKQGGLVTEQGLGQHFSQALGWSRMASGDKFPSEDKG